MRTEDVVEAPFVLLLVTPGQEFDERTHLGRQVSPARIDRGNGGSKAFVKARCVNCHVFGTPTLV